MKSNFVSSFTRMPDRTFSRALTGCGLFLAGCELYKQLFLFYIINQGHYDWWYFPFQLCSLPMYLCLLIPRLPKGWLKTSLCTFLQDYSILGGVAALIVSEGFSGIHWTLTAHGYVWHLLLIGISVLIALTGRADVSRKGFLHTLPLFFTFSAIAMFINVAAPGHGQADMFYISPYYPTPQPIFHEIALVLGTWPANLMYLLTIVTGGFLVHQLVAKAASGKYQNT